MIKSRLLWTGFLCLFLTASARSGQTEKINESVAAIKQELAQLDLSTADVSILSLWSLPLTVPLAEEALRDPLAVPPKINALGQEILEGANGSASLGVAQKILYGQDAEWTQGGEKSEYIIAETVKIKPALKKPIEKIVRAMLDAGAGVEAANLKISSGEKEALLAIYKFPGSRLDVAPPYPPSVLKKMYGAMEKLDQKPLLVGAFALMQRIEESLPDLRLAAKFEPWDYSRRFPTPAGDVWIRGSADNLYTAEDLKNLALLVDLGGNNLYLGPVAGARENEVKVAIDFGESVVVRSTAMDAAAGAGIFGVGLFYLPNPAGRKEIRTLSYSQGFGIGGVGGFFVNGPGEFKGVKNVQGVGHFGVGLFISQNGDESSFVADLYAQGVGFTRGVGIFTHQGSSATLLAGLVNPDPREPLGATSLCQGVGYGPRGYAGGGVGICLLSGSHMRVESSYFAQGAGYWHGLGSFALVGNNNSIKARRYDQGSGIHTAFGHFILNGNNNHVVNWGVGPAFGWDMGIGWAHILGDNNKVQAEWGTGTASVNGSQSYSYYSGNDLVLDLPGLGGGQYMRDAVDYSVAVVRGKNIRMKHPHFLEPTLINQSLYNSPWGSVRLEGVTLSTQVGLSKAEWSLLPPDPMFQEKGINLEEEIHKALALPAKEKIEKLVQVAAEFSMNKELPRVALGQLLMVPEAELPYLVEQLDPVHVEGLMQIQVALALWGKASEYPILSRWSRTEGAEHALMQYFMTFVAIEKAVAPLLKDLTNSDFRIRAQAVKILGQLMSRSSVNQYGRYRVLESLILWAKNARPAKKAEMGVLRHLTRLSFAETVSIFSTGKNWTSAERLEILSASPKDILEPMNEAGARQILKILSRDRVKALARFKNEVRALDAAVNDVRAKLLEVLDQDSNAKHANSIVSVILVALGQIGDPRDGAVVFKQLDHSRSIVRERASAALGRIGDEAFNYAVNAYASESPRMRISAIKTMSQTSAPKFVALLSGGILDPELRVRGMALSIISSLSEPLAKEKQKLIKKLKKSIKSESNPWVRIQYRNLFSE